EPGTCPKKPLPLGRGVVTFLKINDKITLVAEKWVVMG
ncbi:unnamed protein product, partial [marine sediment metagenome]